ncbi:MAG TPA: MBL fold metallo-hydrolase [Candidatus Binatia bacterium]|jgi:glyoxylase-like metal-dependent hydrolase (beta-lactamase superfamily II)
MIISISAFLSTVMVIIAAGVAPLQAQSTARALLEEAAKAMGGLQALRSLKNQVVESEGKQFEPAQAQRPGGPTRHAASFRYILTRDLTQPRLRLEWDAQTHYPSVGPLKYVEVVNGSVGSLMEAAKPVRLHPARLATRLREENRAAVKILSVALGQKSLRRLADAGLDGKQYQVLAFKEGADEFRIYLDAKTKLPTQVEILEDDPLEGDTRFTLRYSDWRKVDRVQVPFSLRFENNRQLIQEERVLSVRHNAALAPDSFSVAEAVRGQKVDAKPIASQWLLRRIAMNTSYADFGRNPPVEFVRLADGVHHVLGTSHNNVVIEMRDHLVVVEAPLYEERSLDVIKAIKQRFQGKPIRYIVPTHHHIDHSGGIRAFMAEGATVVAPVIAGGFYTHVAKAPHTLRPDSLQKIGRAVALETHGNWRELTDGSRQIEIYALPTPHAEDFQIVYLPREKILIEADHASPRKNQIRPGPNPNALLQGIEKLKLDVGMIAGIHGDTGDMQGLRAAAAKAGGK